MTDRQLVKGWLLSYISTDYWSTWKSSSDLKTNLNNFLRTF